MIAEAHLAWGQQLAQTSQYPLAKVHLEMALQLAHDCGAQQVEADTLRNLGNVALDMEPDYSTTARTYYEESLHLCRAIGDQRGESAALNNLGLVALTADHYTEALPHFTQSLLIARELGDRLLESISLSNMGCIQTFTHEYASGKQHLLFAIKIQQDMGARQDEGIAYWSLGYLLLSCGDLHGARVALENAQNLLNQIGARSSEARVLGDIALLCLREGRYPAARDYCRRAFAMADEVGLHDVHVYNLVTLGHAFSQLNKPSEAALAYQQAIKIDEELQKYFQKIEPICGLARLDLNARRTSHALARIEQVLDILRRAQSTTACFDDSLSSLNDAFAVYLSCYHVLQSAQDPRAAPTLLQAYHLLLTYADRAGDDAIRKQYLENITSHRQIIAEFKALSGGSTTLP